MEGHVQDPGRTTILLTHYSPLSPPPRPFLCRKDPDFSKRVKEIAAAASPSSSGGVSLILDPVGASFWKQNAECAALDSRWVLYGSMGGIAPEGPLFGALLRKRITLRGTTLRSRDDQYKADLVARFAREALPLLANGTFKPVIDAEFPLAEVGEAHALMESNKNTGKILLRVKERD
jgi:tumor protein p53-inducible protein 3